MTDKIANYLIEAIESNDASLFNSILEELKTVKPDKEIIEGISLIIEAFLENPAANPNRASFLIEVMRFIPADLPLLRTALPLAIKAKLSSAINKTTFIKVIGAKNTSVSLPAVYSRYNMLTKLTEGLIYHSLLSKSWGKTGSIDWIVGTISLFDFNGLFLHDVELESFLDKSFIFTYDEEIISLSASDKLPDKDSFCSALQAKSINNISEMSLKIIAQETYVPGKANLNDFNLWWNASTIKNKENSSAKNSIPASRSIQELHNALRAATGKISGAISNRDEINHVATILNQIKTISKLKDYMNWAECICSILPLIPEDYIKLLAPKNESVHEIVWPDEELTDVSLGIWANLKALDLTVWVNFTEHIKGNSYLITALQMLPLKVWTAISGKLSVTSLESMIEEAGRGITSEMLLWIWKNKEKVSPETLSRLNYSVVIPAIYRSKTGALWQAGPKDLRKLILDNPDFLSQILGKDSEDNIIGFIEYVNNSSALSLVDRQTIIVKLSRLSAKIKDILNSDKAKRLISNKQQRNETASKTDYFITSNKSYREKSAELQELLNKHIPENTEAIATARAHGDLRENAEYSAAKERQKFLNEQRIMLESRIVSTRTTDFEDVEVGDTVIVGSTIKLKLSDGKTEVYHILGSWDSDPSKKYVSYETELGKAVTGQKLNDSVTLPDGRECEIVSIEKISRQIIEDLK